MWYIYSNSDYDYYSTTMRLDPVSTIAVQPPSQPTVSSPTFESWLFQQGIKHRMFWYVTWNWSLQQPEKSKLTLAVISPSCHPWQSPSSPPSATKCSKPFNLQMPLRQKNLDWHIGHLSLIEKWIRASKDQFSTWILKWLIIKPSWA